MENKNEQELLVRWRMILGKKAEDEQADQKVALEDQLQAMDDALEALYDSERKGGLGSSSPNINRWLGDIREYFPDDIVEVVQKDALERLDLAQLLKEPEFLEMLEPNVELVATILSLNKVLPAKSRESARIIVNRLVEKIMRLLREPTREAVTGAINRAQRNLNPRLHEINWNKTVMANLKNYRPELSTIIPEKLIGYGKKRAQLKHVILLVDQSGSMASSVVYSCIIGSILAALRSIKTHMIVFDTSVIDLTDQLEDPVDLLFATQLGGGTHIGKAIDYAATLVTHPADTLLFLVSDLHEGGHPGQMIAGFQSLIQKGVKPISILALNDRGVPSYDRTMAAQLAQMGIPAFACSPQRFPELLSVAIRGGNLSVLDGKGIKVKN